MRHFLLLVGVAALLACSPNSPGDDDDDDNDATASPSESASPSPSPSPILAALVTDDTDPTMQGNGVPSVWNYAAQIGIVAGNDMCVAAGGDHICTYAELAAAEQQGDLDSLADGTTIWLHRVAEVVMVGNVMSPPGAGGRCNDWTDPGNNLTDGEFLEVQAGGTIVYHFDDDTVYDMTTAHQQPGVLQCGGEQRAIACCVP